MNTATLNCLASIKLGEPQVHRNICILPLISPSSGDCNWTTLSEAMETNTLTVTEISQGGSVPELKVTNSSDRPVLLLDGEELIGAKQNRVLNTTILLKEKSETVVPVSCTEHGRWAYSSAKFADAGVVMAHSSRARKSSSVSNSLVQGAHYKSDQGEVWESIAALHVKAGTSSKTGAMHDLFKARAQELDDGLKAFPAIAGQTGLLAVINGEIAGFDVIPHPTIYAREHSRLIKSYVIDALADREPKAADAANAKTRAADFLRTVTETDERSFASIGYGTDYRYRKTGIAGAALVHSDQVIHSAFFALPMDDPGMNPMAALNRRREHFS